MPMKGSGSGSLRSIDRHEAGVGWIAYPDETMQRASHAVRGADGLWLLDPVDCAGLDELIDSVDAEPAGVVVCLARHERDAASVARRQDVPVFVPEWMTRVTVRGVERRTFGDRLADDVRAIRVRDSTVPPWQEVALLFEESGTLYVPEAVGASDYMVTGRERLGVHPMLRLFPPEVLRGLDPDRIVVGHGEGVHENAGRELTRALDGSRSNSLSLYAKTARSLLG